MRPEIEHDDAPLEVDETHAIAQPFPRAYRRLERIHSLGAASDEERGEGEGEAGWVRHLVSV
jgi:hypothetical protein